MIGEVHYQGPDDEGSYRVLINEDWVRFSRKALTTYIAVHAQGGPLDLYINGSDEPTPFPRAIQKRLAAKELKPEDLLIGTSAYPPQGWDKPTPYFPLRCLDGDETYECPACGGYATMGAGYLNCSCGAELPFTFSVLPEGPIVQWGVLLRHNPQQEKWFIARPWNPSPPWMTREELETLLGQE